MPRHPVFTPQEISVFRRAIDTYRAPGAYEPGKWSVSPLNRRPEIVGTLPGKIVLRDIAVRTTEQMPGVVLPAAERMRLLQAVVEAGVPSVQVGAFGRTRSRADMRADVVHIKEINPHCEVVYGGLTSVDHIQLAAAVGIDNVQFWAAPYAEAAAITASNSLYRKAWADEAYTAEDLVSSVEAQLEIACQLVCAGHQYGITVSVGINQFSFAPRCTGGSGNRRLPLPSPNERVPFYCWPTDRCLPPPRDTWNSMNGMSANGRCVLSCVVSTVCTIKNAPADGRVFPPVVALYVVKLACERPDVVGRSLSQWDSAELARQVVRDGAVEAISPQTVQQILAHHKLQPWRHHLWLSPQVPRDAAFAAQIQELVVLYTRPLGVWEMVLCVDEKTSLQPRPRKAPTLAAQPGQPVRVEHEYIRKGALNLFAGFDTRTGKVYATTAARKRQVEFIAFLEYVDREIAPTLTTMHVVLDNVRMHKGQQVQAWLAKHPRFVLHFPPVHCSWMNQVEQWFSILQRKRLQIADFADKQHLAERLMAFVAEWNEHAHPFRWSTTSVAKVMAKCENPVAKAA